MLYVSSRALLAREKYWLLLILKRAPDLLKGWNIIWNDKFRECKNLLQQGVTRKYSHGYLIKSNSPISPELLLWIVQAIFDLFYLVLAHSSLFLLAMGCSTFYKKVKAHKVRQKLETLKKSKGTSCTSKMKAHKALEKMRVCNACKKMKARNARKKMKTRKPCKKQKHVRHVKKMQARKTYSYFMWGGREFHVFGLKYLMLLLPKLTGLTIGISRLSLYWLGTALLVTLSLK